MIWFAVGSKNKVKVGAVRTALMGLRKREGNALVMVIRDLFSVRGYRVESGVDEQPVGLNDILRGARARALAARAKSMRPRSKNGIHHVGIGLESGVIFWIDEKRTLGEQVCLDVCACAFAVENEGGLRMAYGLSGGFAVPHEVAGLLSSEVTLAEAAKKAGLTKKNKLGSAEGLIGVLSDGRIDRFDQTKQAVDMALVQAIPLLRSVRHTRKSEEKPAREALDKYHAHYESCAVCSDARNRQCRKGKALWHAYVDLVYRGRRPA